MSLSWFRARLSPIASVTVLAYFNGTLFLSGPAFARAGDAAEKESSVPAASYGDDSKSALSKHVAAAADPSGSNGANASTGSPGKTPPPLPADAQRALAALPSGGGGITSQAAALPSGAATQLGMGESFTMQLSTGTSGYSVPFALPAARGRAQPKLGLSYSSAGGFGLAGVGWGLSGTAISRQTDRGIPAYDDRSNWHPGQDRFVFGGAELVPICTVTGSTCSGAISGEKMPSWSAGWQYFRARVEGEYLRFFWSSDHRTWHIQSKDGTEMELGVPLDGTNYEGGLARNPDKPSEINSWYVTREYDNHVSSTGVPVNTVVSRYTTDANSVYLSDLFDTPPAASPTTTDLSTYAHHSAISYELRPDPVVSYRAGYPAQARFRVHQVDVTSKPFSGAGTTARSMLRRYHLNYDPLTHRSLLRSVQVEGRCATPLLEGQDQRLPLSTCPRLPPVSFDYQQVASSTAPPVDAQGLSFDSIDGTVHALDASPPHSLDEPDTGLMDVNGDGLPDLLVTSAGAYNGKHGLYLNGSGTGATIGLGQLTTMAVLPAGDVTDAGVLSLHSPTVAALDLDSDGRVDLVHMPQAKRYGVFSVTPNGSGGYQWTGRDVSTASQQNVKIDFTREAANVRVLDVNGDGLVDIVYSSATELQTFFALGRFPGGDGQFGSALLTSASAAQISNEPITACAPWSGTVVRFNAPDTQLADMNGDGLTDIVRVTDGRILYWPGRGNGFWGTGSRSDCKGGTFADNRHIEMSGSPRFGTADPGTLLLNDVNGDGLADVVEIRSTGVDIYLNDNGSSWTSRYTIDQTPFRPAGSNYVQLVDINGSGTPDILWGRAREYQYIDLTGAKTPNLLTRVSSGFGQSTDLEYSSSADLMRAATAAGNPWKSVAPIATPVLVRSTVKDNLDRVGRKSTPIVTEYSYRDPVYEGRQREFRGFSEATVKSIGDASSPTSYTRSVFQLGECPQGLSASQNLCQPSARWQDNWREPLKGLPVLSETFDDNGVYAMSEHTTYKLRQLYEGLDGRNVSVVLPVATDSYVYDTASFDHVLASTTLDEVVVDVPGSVGTETRSLTLRATAGTAHLRQEGTTDDFGNTTASVRRGCISGCPNGADEALLSHSEFALPPGDTSGWHWRETRAYVSGSVNTAATHEMLHTYNAAGDLEASYSVLSGGLALDLRHAVAGAATAPQPPNASLGTSTPAQILADDPSYDLFGNITASRGPSGHCSSRTYDADYQQLVTDSHVMAGPVDGTTGCGSRDFKNHVTYDRGQQAVTDSIDVQQQPSHFDFDGFGRLVAATYADPANPGVLAQLPRTKISYELPVDAPQTPYSVTITQTQTGADPNTNTYSEQRTVLDGLGRTLLVAAPADRTAGDAGDWIADGYVDRDAKGEVARAYDPIFFSGALTSAALGAALSASTTAIPYRSGERDAFGRAARSYGYDHNVSSLVVMHALSTDLFDAADILPTAHQGTYSTIVTDGHGRSVQQILRIKVGTTLEARTTFNEYLPGGELSRVVQRRAGSPDLVRWLKYDSQGRRVLNVEPNTTTSFNADPNTAPDSMHAWRYAYDDAGDMVGFSDSRGCGAEYFYDAGGRLLAEDRSPCLASQAAYSIPNLTSGDGTEAFYRYDSADPEVGSVIDAGGTRLDIDISLLWGRVVSVSSLAAKSIYQYDALGRGIGTAVRLQKPGTSTAALATRYAPGWYVKKASFDAASRPLTLSSGASTPELLGGNGKSELQYSYTKRGGVAQIGGSYGTLYAGGVVLADGRPQSFTLGDIGGTQRYFTYDTLHRVKDVQTYRGTPSLWSTPTGGYVPPSPTDEPTRPLLLEDASFTYDEVGNLIRAEDDRLPGDWPASAKPVTRNFEYDDLYRLTRTTYEYPGGAVDSWRSPFAAEDHDPTAVQPSPHTLLTSRPTEQKFQYDWLGNLSQSSDDSSAFWDRSTGIRTHGTVSAGPHQVQSASNRLLSPSSALKGDASLSYDSAGNLTGLIIRRDGPCLPTGSSCWQRFDYEWDEVEQLVHARRWDLSVSQNERSTSLAQPVPARSPDAELRFAYDETGQRRLRSAVDQLGNQKHTLFVFSTLEARTTDFSSTTNDYVINAAAASVQFAAGPATARVTYAPAADPTVNGLRQHVSLTVGDSLGSTSIVIDKATSELVEAATYQTYGALETDYRPARWASYRAPYKFTGKEEDIEVGLTYFGARYYSPYLSTWISPDPVSIHDLGSDANPYAYVRGTPMMGVDPDGRIFWIPIIIIVLAAAAISAAVDVSNQRKQQEMYGTQMDIGEVAGSAAIGAAAAGVSIATGGAATPFVTGLLGGGAAAACAGGIIGGALGGVAGSATGYGLRNGSHSTAKGLGTAVAIGGLSGAAGGLGGGVTGTAIERGIGAGVLGTVTGIGVNHALTGQNPNGTDLLAALLSIGSGAAASAYSSYAASTTVERIPVSDSPGTEPGGVGAGPKTSLEETTAARSVGDRLRAAAAAYRQSEGVSKGKNIGVSALEVDGEVVDTKIAVSGERPRNGSVGTLETSVLQPKEVGGYIRQFDSEFKLMQDFANTYSTSTQGTLHIFTELPPCASCGDVGLSQIPQIYPGITVRFHY